MNDFLKEKAERIANNGENKSLKKAGKSFMAES